MGKRKTVLDQLATGLEILGFQNKIKQNPEIFEELFVHNKNVLNGKKVCNVLEFVTSSDYVSIKEYLEHFLMNATKDVLEKILAFATGAPCLPSFGLGKITIKISESMAISAQMK